MANVFLIGGGGDQPKVWPDVYGRFLQAAGGEGARLALVAVGSSPADADEILTFYRRIFESLGLPSGQIFDLPLTAGQHLEKQALESLNPSGVCLCANITPLCQQVTCADTAWVAWLQEHNLPFCGVGSGAVVASERAVMGGWCVTVDEKQRPFQAKWASEDIDDLEVRPGLGLAPFAVECHAGQRGNLTRLIHAVAMEMVSEGWAIDEDTLLEIGNRGIYTNGLGHTYRLQIHHMGRVEVSLFRDGGGVMRG